MKGREALATATERLRAAGVPDAVNDARRLLQYAMKASQFVLIDLDSEMTGMQLSVFQDILNLREARVPMSHITGRREFYGRSFRVSSEVLDPRPDTETLIDSVLRQPFERVLDLGTGSGCILATLLAERPNATGVGTDLSASALKVAEQNISELQLTERAKLIESDWFTKVDGRFDLIVSNPPYIALDEMEGLQPEVQNHEPRMALTDEGDGLSCYRAIISQTVPYLFAGGRIVVEIGPTQGVAVSALMVDADFDQIEIIQDLDGRDRVVVGHKPHK